MLHWTVHLPGGPERFNHAAVAVHDKVYSFGGYCNLSGKDQIDVHVFNTVSLRWTKLPPLTTGRGERPLEVPPMCCWHTAALIDDVIYVWGGVVNFEMAEFGDWATIWGDKCNMLYAFDVNTHGWFKPGVSGVVPEARYGHSAWVFGRFMYIYGGYNRLCRYYNDIHILDTKTMAWSLVNTRGTPPPASSRHSATIIGTKMFVFGGRGEQLEYTNLSVFDTETNRWLHTPSFAQLLPEGRSSHSAFAYNGELYVFGGHNFRLRLVFNDLWKFSPETFSWKKVKPGGNGPCRMTNMCCCMVGDHVIFFGGYRYTEDELYILDLGPSLKTLCKLAVIQCGLEQSGLPHSISWEMAAMTTEMPSRN